jgi:hypothetical protein
MIPDSLRVPVPAHEASALADLIFQFAEGRRVDEALRRMLASRASQGALGRLRVHWGSLVPDPVAKSTYYVAVDAPAPVLLHVAIATAPGTGLFPGASLVGFMRTPKGQEVVVNAIPFGAGDAERIRAYATKLDRAVLPGPQGVETLFLAASRDADTAFAQYRGVQRKYGLSVAAWTGDVDEGLWGAIRHGWRDGYAMRGEGEPATRAGIDASGLRDEELGERIGLLRRLRGRNFDVDVRFDAPGVLTRVDALRARLEALRSEGRGVQVVAVELGLRPDAPYPAELAEMTGWPAEIVSNVQWKAAGKPLVELRQRVEELQQTARQYGAILGVTGYGSTGEAVLEAIGAGAARRLWFELGEGMGAERIGELAGLLRG